MFVSPMFTSITRTVNAWRRAETVRRELSQLSDRELADIGISRSDIDRIADEEAHLDPTYSFGKSRPARPARATAAVRH
jgi:uncharacterized protein YjiS (DUF1127 family)